MDSEHLYVAESTIPNIGMGLFTKEDIKKGTLIIEYVGEITKWEAVRYDPSNAYLYYVNDDYVINAKDRPEVIARYANDAYGLTKINGLHNNSRFVNVNGRIFIKSTRNIPAGSEILVNYGKGYWETVRENVKHETANRKREE